MGGSDKYLYIFPLSVGGKEWDKERECEGGGNELLQSEFLFLSNLMVAKGLL